ncbi:MAG TPA: TolC family protein [Acidobacteriota bacterium]|nr:TolC family protein [Acidobacteriota bacterium]
MLDSSVLCRRFVGLLVAVAVPAFADAAPQQEAALELSLPDAVQLAFENNLDIRVVAYDRSLAEERVTTAKGQFEPSLFFGVPGAIGVTPYPTGGAFGGGSGFGGLGYSNQRFPVSTQLAGADVTTQRSFASLLDFQQQLGFGLRYDVSYVASRTDSNSIFNSLNPAWNNTLAVSVVQPLLNGRGRDATQASLRLARANTAVSRVSFVAQVEQVLLQVEQAYWELVFAERDLEVKESSWRLATEQLERTRVQVEVGLTAPVEATQAEVQVAGRETDLIVARNALDNSRDALRALLRADRLPAGWETQLIATEEPTVVAAEIDVDAAVQQARERRAEMAAAAATIGARHVEVEATRNALLPRIDLIGQVSANGIGGDLIVRDGFFGDVVEVVPGSYNDAVKELFGLGFTSWSAGFNITVPLGNSAAEGNYAQATLNEDRARTERLRTEQQIVLEVRLAARGVRAASEAVESTRKTLGLAEQQLGIETDRFDVGMSTNFEVLQFQDQLAVARSQELRARIEHQRATAELARATGTLLDKYGIRIQ